MLHLLFGAIYRWAMINVYITSYYKTTNDPFIETSRNSIGAPISMLAAGVTMKSAIRLSKFFEGYHKLGKLIMLSIVVVLLGGQVMISSYMPSYLCRKILS